MRYLDSTIDLLNFIRLEGRSAILFYSDWCPFSIMMRNSFDAVEPSHPGVVFGKARLDVIGPEELLLPVASIPTLVLFLAGQIVDSFVGVLSPAELSRRIGDFELIGAGEEATNLGTSRVRDTVRCNRLLSLKVPKNILRYQAKSHATVIDVSTGREIGRCSLDCNETLVLIFFNYLRTCDLEGGLFANGELTKKCANIIRCFKRDHGLNGDRIPGIERPEDGDQKYLAKQISRVNRKLLKHIGARIIERDDGEYRLADGVKLRILKS
jgi:thiol-disulfide isomerase/thioredoxin